MVRLTAVALQDSSELIKYYSSITQTDVRCSVFEKSQFIRIWPRPCQEPKYFHACFDTGACANFIRASVVADLDLPTTTCDTSYETGNGEVHVDRYVQPDWQLIQGQKRHQEYRFFLLRDMPHGIDLVVGTDFMNDTGITLRVNRTLLITFPSSRKGSLYFVASEACIDTN